MTDIDLMFYDRDVPWELPTVKPIGLMTKVVEGWIKRRKASKTISQTKLRRIHRSIKKRANAACLSTRYILQHPGDKLPDGRPKMTRAEARSHNRRIMATESRRRNLVYSAWLNLGFHITTSARPAKSRPTVSSKGA